MIDQMMTDFLGHDSWHDSTRIQYVRRSDPAPQQQGWRADRTATKDDSAICENRPRLGIVRLSNLNPGHTQRIAWGDGIFSRGCLREEQPFGLSVHPHDRAGIHQQIRCRLAAAAVGHAGKGVRGMECRTRQVKKSAACG